MPEDVSCSLVESLYTALGIPREGQRLTVARSRARPTPWRYGTNVVFEKVRLNHWALGMV